LEIEIEDKKNKKNYKIFRVPQINYGDTQTYTITASDTEASDTERTLEFIGMKEDVVGLNAEPSDDSRLSFSIHRIDNTMAMNRLDEFSVDAKGERRITLPEDGRYLVMIRTRNYAGDLRLTLNADVQFFNFFEDQEGVLSREQPALRYRFFASRDDVIRITLSSPAPEFERVFFYDMKSEKRQGKFFEMTLESTGYYTFALDASEFFAQQPESAAIPFTFKAEWAGQSDRLRFYNLNNNFKSFHTLPNESLTVVAGTSLPQSQPIPMTTPTPISTATAGQLVVNILETSGNPNPFLGSSGVGWHLVRDARTLRLLGWARVPELSRNNSPALPTLMPAATPTLTLTPTPAS
jgi:hypothetical protein